MSKNDTREELHGPAAPTDVLEVEQGIPLTPEHLAERAAMERLDAIARQRSQSPAETLEAALDALVAPLPAVRPAGSTLGQQACRCDGPEEAGPHHKPGCERRQ